MDNLEIRKGLEELAPMEAFKRNPCEFTLFNISKTLHSLEMLEEIFNNPRPEDRGLLLLQIVSKRLITRSVCERAVLRNARNIIYTPDEFIDEKFCEYMIDHHISLSWVPNRFRNRELCEKAVLDNWRNLDYVPKRIKNKKMCEYALEQSIAAIRFCPGRMITSELALEAIKHSDSIVNDLKEINAWPVSFIPQKLRTDEMIDLSLSLFPESMASLPPDLITTKRAYAVVNQDGCLLRILPDEYRSQLSIIKAALTQNPMALQFVPDDKITREMCDDAFEKMLQEKQFCGLVFPDEYRDDYRKRYESIFSVLHTQPIRLYAYEENKSVDIIEKKDNNILTVYDITEDDKAAVQRVYYVSDLHLEHQLDINNKTLSTVENGSSKTSVKLLLFDYFSLPRYDAFCRVLP